MMEGFVLSHTWKIVAGKTQWQEQEAAGLLHPQKEAEVSGCWCSSYFILFTKSQGLWEVAAHIHSGPSLLSQTSLETSHRQTQTSHITQ